MTEKKRVIRVDRSGFTAKMDEEAAELADCAELLGADCATEDEIIEKAAEAEVILTAGAQMTRRVMENLPDCRAIIRYGIGVDTVDLDAATDHGICVVNVPDFCFEEVSNHAIALLLACAKKVVVLNNRIKEQGWGAAMQALAPMVSIHGQTLGIVGCGNIGRATAEKARCFGLTVLGYDPYLDVRIAAGSGISLVGLPELLEESDFVSIHTPLNDETRHLIGEAEFCMMKPSAYFINTSRGPVVDEPALIRALEEGRIAGAGLDVFEKEPIDPENPLLKMENAIVMPHTASYSDEAFSLLRTCVGQEAARVARNKRPKNVVNSRVTPKKPFDDEGDRKEEQ